MYTCTYVYLMYARTSWLHLSHSILFSHLLCLKWVKFKRREKNLCGRISFTLSQKRVAHCYANEEHVAQGNCYKIFLADIYHLSLLNTKYSAHSKDVICFGQEDTKLHAALIATNLCSVWSWWCMNYPLPINHRAAVWVLAITYPQLRKVNCEMTLEETLTGYKTPDLLRLCAWHMFIECIMGLVRVQIWYCSTERDVLHLPSRKNSLVLSMRSN